MIVAVNAGEFKNYPDGFKQFCRVNLFPAPDEKKKKKEVFGECEELEEALP